MIVVSKVLYLMLANVGLSKEKKCNTFDIMNKHCYSGY